MVAAATVSIAKRLEVCARIIDHFSDQPFGDLDEFRRFVYDP
jgi:hypothetical protein